MISNAILAFCLGVLLISGPTITIGVEPELTKLDLPSVPALGIILLTVSVICLLPPWVRTEIYIPFKKIFRKRKSKDALSV